MSGACVLQSTTQISTILNTHSHSQLAAEVCCIVQSCVYITVSCDVFEIILHLNGQVHSRLVRLAQKSYIPFLIIMPTFIQWFCISGQSVFMAVLVKLSTLRLEMCMFTSNKSFASSFFLRQETEQESQQKQLNGNFLASHLLVINFDT